MKIPLLIKEETKTIAGVSFIEKRIILPSTLWGRVLVKAKFIIDTGSPFSFISYPDYSRLKPQKREMVVKDMVIGDATVNLFKISNFKFYVRGENKKPFAFETKGLAIAISSKKGKKDRAYKLPNIIGLDFLEIHNIKLFVDMKNKNCYLEIKD